jgi:3',5'-cyclic AMP phosphodiesterase CpdA
MLIAQLSDIHVRPRGELYKGVADSNRMFTEALTHLGGLERRPDLVVLTGDLVDEGDPDEYANLRALLGALDLPYLVMPGNHDERENFRRSFADHPYLPRSGPLHYCVDDYALRLVALDTTVPGAHHGALDQTGLDWLLATLSENRAKPTLVLMHHPPFLSGIPYLDPYRYVDDEALADVLGQFQNIEAVLCGHVHRAMARRWAGTIVLACPSTTTQIALDLVDRARGRSYIGPAACLLHLWTPESGLISHTSSIGSFPGPFPFF